MRLTIARTAMIGALLLLWELGTRAGLIDPYFVSRPTKIAVTVAGWFVSGFIYPHVWATVHEAVIGLALGIVAGIIVGVVFAFFPFVSDLFRPLIVIFNAT